MKESAKKIIALKNKSNPRAVETIRFGEGVVARIHNEDVVDQAIRLLCDADDIRDEALHGSLSTSDISGTIRTQALYHIYGSSVSKRFYDKHAKKMPLKRAKGGWFTWSKTRKSNAFDPYKDLGAELKRSWKKYFAKYKRRARKNKLSLSVVAYERSEEFGEHVKDRGQLVEKFNIGKKG